MLHNSELSKKNSQIIHEKIDSELNSNSETEQNGPDIKRAKQDNVISIIMFI